MAPTQRKNLEPLARVNFPMYSIQMLSNRHLLVGGGGGSPNSGVKNAFEIFEISHDGKQFISEHVLRHLTGPNAVMNCSSLNVGKHIYFVTGQENHCQLYCLKPTIVTSSSESSDNAEQDSSASSVRHRKPRADSDGDGRPEKDNDTRDKSKTERVPSDSDAKLDSNGNSYKRLTFVVQTNDSIQTDFSEKEPVQKVVRISPGPGTLMVSGGSDGHLRVWQFPQLVKKLDIAAHSKEVDDLDISPNAKCVVSVSKDNRTITWDLETGKRIQSFTWTPPEGSKYLYKRCRFGIVEGDVNKYRLFTLTNPVGKTAKLKSQLQLWDTETATLKKMHGFVESLSALAVSDDGRFVAVGTMFSGSVSMLVAWSLQPVLNVAGAHSMFVTGLAFLPTAGDGPPVTSLAEASVVSISVDNRVCIHSLSYRRSIQYWVAIVFIVAALFFAFMLCSYIGI